MHRDLTIFDLILFALRQGKTLLIHLVVVSAVAVCISLVLPKTYRSTVVFIPPGASGGALSSLIGDRFDLDIISGSRLTKRQYIVLLNSRELREQLIHKFDLTQVYKLTKGPAPIDRALRKLKQNVKVSEEVEGGLGISDIISVGVTVSDRTPARAAEMANYLYGLMEERAVELRNHEYTKMERYLDEQIQDCDSMLVVARKSLREFQVSNKVYDVPSQVSMVLKAVALNEAERLTLEKRRDLLRKHLTRDHPSLREIDERIQVLRAKTAELENKMTIDMVPGLKLSLTLGDQYLDLLKEVETYVQIRIMLRKQLELARIRSSVDYSSAYLVDAARPAQWKSKPKRAFVVLGIVLLYMTCLSVFLLARERYARLQTETPQRLDRIREALRRAWHKKQG